MTRVLETERLLLRHLTMADLDDLAALYRDPEVRRYFPDGTRSYEQTREELAWYLEVHYARHGFGLWATIERASGAFVGRCGLLPWTIDGRSEIEVAYLLDPRWWGGGLATEAARAIVDYAFERIGAPRLIALVDPAHGASARVAEKAGMTLERTVDGIDGDGIPTLIYAIRRPRAAAPSDPF